MLSIRDIIKEACTRINLVPRKQAVPGDILENAFRLLKGVVDKYNKDNLLSWTQNSLLLDNKSLIHIFDEYDTLKGDYNYYYDTVEQLGTPDAEMYQNNALALVKSSPNVIYKVIKPLLSQEAYVWQPTELNDSQRVQEMLRYQEMYHYQVRDLDKINSIYLISPANVEYKEMFKLDYVNHTDFGRYSPYSKAFTYTQKSEGEWLIEIKPQVARNNGRLKINYNEGIKFDLDTDLYVPDNYIELLIVALAHKLALVYPRLDDAQMSRLQTEVSVLVDNVKTPAASDRILLRDDYWSAPRRMTQAELMDGDWLFRN